MIFPQLAGKPSKEVNLNSLAQEWFTREFGKMPDNNPLIDPEICQKMVQDFHAQNGVAFSYGGYLEDRSTVWAGSYLQPKNTFLHLAVDFNAEPGTEVAVDQEAEVVFTGDDTPLIGGWGVHVMLKLIKHPIYLLYAHLGSGVSCRAGDILAAGTVFARLGTPATNGHWYSHVHVQALTPEAYEQYAQDFDSLDGYGKVSEKASLAQQFPDPMQWVVIS
jgi:murein DD-endopeptidase MepM/ murein hydrolase activator NlpD